MIGKNSKETFFGLLHDNKMTARELAALVKINGVQYVSRWGDWQVALPDDPKNKEAVNAALEEIATAAAAFATNDLRWMENFYLCKAEGTHHPLDNFGFNLGEDGELLVEKTPLQTQEDLLRQLQSELTDAKQEIHDLKNQLKEISTWTGFADVEDELVPLELDLALQVYRAAISNYDRKTARMNNGDTVKAWMQDELKNSFEVQKESVANRISIVANWSKEAGRPKSDR
jgi:hypothetical protein